MKKGSSQHTMYLASTTDNDSLTPTSTKGFFCFGFLLWWGSGFGWILLVGGGVQEVGFLFVLLLLLNQSILEHLCTNLSNCFPYKLADQSLNWQQRWKTSVLKHVDRQNWDLKRCCWSAPRGVLPQGMKTSSLSDPTGHHRHPSGGFWEPTEPTPHTRKFSCASD